MFDTVLIANRGEIALRVARTCRELGLRTVAVYSSADADSAVVRFADQSVHIGPANSKHSYLNPAALIEAAVQTGAQAIHPGYGFLSEDADFAQICAENDIVFIGPSPKVMAMLSDKSEARTAMAAAGLPVLPGSPAALTSLAEADALAGRIGFPLILKAVAGGGGRGMAVVTARTELARAYDECRAGAQAIFGDGRLYAERYLPVARHVEVQVLCDGHGGAVSLGERDCSVQRRHQKLIEEAPAPRLPDGLARRMGDAAVRGALAVGYEGVGTFEFLVDPGGEFYFMEINCRIQVEHPVTELVTGLDLIREQLLVAAGGLVSLRQEDLVPRGVAIECRVNAEDPDRGFRPAPGVLTGFDLPGGPFTRVDTHCVTGYTIPPNYDSLLAKLIVWAPDRDQALARMDRALSELRVNGPGVRTTTDFLRRVLAQPRFRAGTHATSLVGEMLG